MTDLAVTGYAWGENIGWVNLSPPGGGVTNDGSGKLSGYAWGENVGWTSFSCENTDSCATVDYRVMINPATGVFSGYAWGENIGWITFFSTGAVPFSIVTSWPEDLCEGDFEPDGDVDGSDLAVFASGFAIGGYDEIDLADFAVEFGTTDCF
ncbi:MAG: hypothetical protein ACYTBP_15305 [Planctomycetota bacterium]